jgi:acyl carrier protein
MITTVRVQPRLKLNINIMNSVSETVSQVLRKLGLRSREITPEKDFRYEMGLDSIEILYMVNLLENKLNISIPDKDISRLENYNTTINYLNHRLAFKN